MIDVMENIKTSIDVLDKGFVRLVDCMPRLIPEGTTADSAICQAARVSYGEGTKTVRKDRGLIRYLLRNLHTSPFEQVEFKFHCKLPLFIARQMVRHRMANLNELSGRYSKMKGEFYFPDRIRRQDTTNKQGSVFCEEENKALAEDFKFYLEDSERQYDAYEELVDQGLARELARIGLPLNLYTEWYWKIDLHNLMHFLKLRMDGHAQWEIQEYGRAIHELISPIVPLTMEAFQDYRVDGMFLSKQEILQIMGVDVKLSETEMKELHAKMYKMETLISKEEEDG